MNGDKSIIRKMNPRLNEVLKYWQKKAFNKGLDLHNTSIQEMAAKYLENLEPHFKFDTIPKSKEKEITLRVIPKRRKNEI